MSDTTLAKHLNTEFRDAMKASMNPQSGEFYLVEMLERLNFVDSRLLDVEPMYQ